MKYLYEVDPSLEGTFRYRHAIPAALELRLSLRAYGFSGKLICSLRIKVIDEGR